MYGLYLAASGAASQLLTLTMSTHNLANLSTPGYRRRELPIGSATAAGSPYVYATTSDAPLVSALQGRLERTDNPLDIAIIGPAFLAVEDDSGAEVYTRDGELALDADGTLLAAGKPLLQINGGPIKLPPGPITISRDGWISVNGIPQARMKLADPGDVAMKPIGDSLYQPSDGSVLPQASSGSAVEQMYLEMPEGSPVAAMVGIINTNRTYEAAMRAIYTIDAELQKATQVFTLNV